MLSGKLRNLISFIKILITQYCIFFNSLTESLRRKDELIKQTLLEKQNIVSSILHIPKMDEEPAETVSELPIEKEPTELILTAIGQGKEELILNELFNI